MDRALGGLRLCVLAIFTAILMATGPHLARAQDVNLDALEKQSQELFEGGSYAEALAAAEKLVNILNERERTVGQPALLAIRGQTLVSWFAIFAHQPEKALEASERALKIEPRFLVPATNRAHALLFLGRSSEARAAYIEHKGEPISNGVKWEEAIAKDFAEFRKRGLTHPMLAEMEEAIAAANPTGKTEQYVPENLQQVRDEVGKLIVQVGYLHIAGKDAEALPLAQRLVALSERAHGAENTAAANNVGQLAEVLAGLGRREEAEAAYKRNIAVLERNGGPVDLNFLPYKLSRLADLYIKELLYAEAEPLLKRAIAMRETAQDPKDVGIYLDALGKLYAYWGLYAEAEASLNRALQIKEKEHGPGSSSTGAVLNNLARVYAEQGRYAEADRHMLRALSIYENDRELEAELHGASNPIGSMLGNLADIYQAQGRYAEAETLLKRALALGEKNWDKSHLALALNNLACLYRTQGRFAEAEPLLKRSLDIVEKLPWGNLELAASGINNLAALYGQLGRNAEAEALLKRSLELRQKTLGPDHLDVALALANLAVRYYERRRYEEAEPLMKQALAIREKALPPDHPAIASGLNNLAELYGELHRAGEAEPLYLRALAIYEKALGPSHPDTAQTIHNLAGFYQGQGRYEEAAQAYKRALAIWENTLGPDHPLVATNLNNTAELYFKQQDWGQAASYWQRSTDILIRRFRRGRANAGVAHAGGAMSEIDQESNRFRRMVRVSYRAAGAVPAEAKAIAARMFETAQWAQGSAAAQSIAQMAASKSSAV